MAVFLSLLCRELPARFRPVAQNRWKCLFLSAKYSHVSTLESLESELSSRPRVYLAADRQPDQYGLPLVLRALRAYSFQEKDETVEISIKCNLSSKRKGKMAEPFRGNLVYPHFFGKEPKLLVFAEESAQESARLGGADIVGGRELFPKVQEQELQFDVCVSTQQMLNEIKPLQKTLRKLMPSEKRETVVESDSLVERIKKLKKSKEYKCNKLGYCNVAIGKLSFTDQMVDENFHFLLDHIIDHQDKISPKLFFQHLVLSSTYGPGFPLSLSEQLQRHIRKSEWKF